MCKWASLSMADNTVLFFRGWEREKRVFPASVRVTEINPVFVVAPTGYYRVLLVDAFCGTSFLTNINVFRCTEYIPRTAL